MNPTKEQLIAYFSGQLPAREKEQVEAWLGGQPDNNLVETCIRLAMEAMPETDNDQVPKSAINAYMRFRELTGERPEADLHQQQAQRSSAPVIPIRRRIYRYAIAAAAACILLGTGMKWFHNFLPAQKQKAVAIPAIPKMYTAAKASITRIKLEDGSVVLLFPGATLTLNNNFNIHDRIVALKGRAYFDVVHDATRPFFVQSGHINTRVLGTAFDISQEQQRDTRIVVKEGSVQVAGPDSIFSRLQPGQRLSVNNISGRWNIQQVDADEYCGWTRGELGFRQMPLKDILPVLELWYNISFRVERPGILDKKLTFFSRRQPVRQAMEVLSSAAGFHYAISADTIIIK